MNWTSCQHIAFIGNLNWTTHHRKFCYAREDLGICRRFGMGSTGMWWKGFGITHGHEHCASKFHTCDTNSTTVPLTRASKLLYHQTINQGEEYIYISTFLLLKYADMFVACHTESKIKYVFTAQQNNIIDKKLYGSLKMHIKELTIVEKSNWKQKCNKQFISNQREHYYSVTDISCTKFVSLAVMTCQTQYTYITFIIRWLLR